MVSVSVRLFTDEHIDTRLAPALIRRGFDVLTCQEAGRANQRISDEEQLVFAANDGRALLTFNTVDFVAFDLQWKQEGRTHAGIIVSAAIGNISELVQRVQRRLQGVTPERQHNTLLWLSARRQ